MARPRKERQITFQTEHNHFMPITPSHIAQETSLDREELEAIRLKDMENFDQKACAENMNISQPTFHRLLKQARKKVAFMLIKGHSLKIKD